MDFNNKKRRTSKEEKVANCKDLSSRDNHDTKEHWRTVTVSIGLNHEEQTTDNKGHITDQEQKMNLATMNNDEDLKQLSNKDDVYGMIIVNRDSCVVGNFLRTGWSEKISSWKSV